VQAACKAATLPGTDAVLSYNMACIASLAAGALSGTDREGIAARAVELLRAAVRAGFREAAHLKSDEDLVPLRAREDFRAVLKEMEAPPEPRSP